MSFLDNLENNLKSLESREEKDPEKIRRDQQRRDAERADALARAPFAEQLKNAAFTSELLGQSRIVGREFRVLVRFTWIGENLRLEAGPKRMELVPTANAIEAVYSSDGVESKRAAVDFEKADAAALVRDWLAS